MKYYYVETDGMIYLVEEEGKLRFPKSLDELDFKIEIKQRMKIEDKEILYCEPKLNAYPHDWWPKDEIAYLERAEPLVRRAVNISLPRVTAKAVILKNKKILLVKPKRGYNQGQWTLPGGFVDYGESPEQAVEREVEEEVGAKCHAQRFLGVESGLGKKTNFHWHTFFYEVELEGEKLEPAPDEIEELSWFDLAEAIEHIGYYQKMKERIKKLFGKRRK